MKVTTEQVAGLLGLEKPEAYGLLHFMSSTGCVELSKAEKVPGRKGKPSTLYVLDRASVEKLSSLLLSKVVEPAERPAVNVAEVAPVLEPVAVEAASSSEVVVDNNDVPGDSCVLPAAEFEAVLASLVNEPDSNLLPTENLTPAVEPHQMF